MTVNLRALIHMSGLRLCTMAQWEIRRLFQLIRHEIFQVSPFLGSFLAPKCVPLGYCDEMNNRDGHCPIRPHKDESSPRGPRRRRPRRPPAVSSRWPRPRASRLRQAARPLGWPAQAGSDTGRCCIGTDSPGPATTTRGTAGCRSPGSRTC
jgi:hypothetical protein